MSFLWILLLVLLSIMSLIELLPYFITILFPSLCYGCTTIGAFHQEILENKYKMGYCNWMAYLCLILFCIGITIRHVPFPELKVLICLVLLILLYLPLYPLLNICNFILLVTVQNPPFLSNYSTLYPELPKLEQHYLTIRKEYLQYTRKNTPSCIRTNNPGFKIERTQLKHSCWRTLFLKLAGKMNTDIASYFPQTLSLLQSPYIHNAFFSILDKGVEIPPHVGYFKGFLRYHLGILIPPATAENKAYIVCDHQKYTWKNGEGVMFDDMYLHYVKNPTQQQRVVLYLDIIRKTNSPFIRSIIQSGIFLIEHAPLMTLFLKNQHKQINLSKKH